MGAPVADQRVLRGTAAVLSWQNLDGDGEAAAPAGTVTVAVTDAAGNTVVASGTSTSGSGAGPRIYTLTAEQTLELNLLTATWTVSGGGTFTTSVEIVGGFYFTVAEARAADPQLSNDTRFPTAAIVAARRQVEEEFEQICGVAFVPRYRRERVSPDYCGNVVLLDQPRIRTIRSITSYDTAGTPTAWQDSELAQLIEIDEGSRITSRSTRWFDGGDTVIEYEHGYDAPPAEVKWAAVQRCRYWAAKASSGIPDKSATFTVLDGGGSYSLARSTPYSTGNDDIDAILGRWSLRVPGLA
jgi:hypothetical protein